MILSQGRDFGNSTVDTGMNIALNNGIPDIRYGHDETSIRISSTKKLNDGKWHMLTFTINEDGIGKFYIDGEKDIESTSSAYCSYNQARKWIRCGKNVL